MISKYETIKVKKALVKKLRDNKKVTGVSISFFVERSVEERFFLEDEIKMLKQVISTYINCHKFIQDASPLGLLNKMGIGFSIDSSFDKQITPQDIRVVRLK